MERVGGDRGCYGEGWWWTRLLWRGLVVTMWCNYLIMFFTTEESQLVCKYPHNNCHYPLWTPNILKTISSSIPLSPVLTPRLPSSRTPFMLPWLLVVSRSGSRSPQSLPISLSFLARIWTRPFQPCFGGSLSTTERSWRNTSWWGRFVDRDWKVVLITSLMRIENINESPILAHLSPTPSLYLSDVPCLGQACAERRWATFHPITWQCGSEWGERFGDIVRQMIGWINILRYFNISDKRDICQFSLLFIFQALLKRYRSRYYSFLISKHNFLFGFIISFTLQTTCCNTTHRHQEACLLSSSAASTGTCVSSLWLKTVKVCMGAWDTYEERCSFMFFYS